MPSLRGALSNQNTFIPPLFYKRVTITSAQWLTLLGTPITIVPAIPGKNIIAEGLQYIVKLVGTAYNAAAVTDIRGNYTGSGSRWFEVANALLPGFTDVTTQSMLLVNNPRNPTVAFNSTVNNGGLTFTTSGGDFTTGTGDFVFWVSYRVYDLSNLAWF